MENVQFSWNPNDTFAGTAWYYARYRPGYPDRIIKFLKQKFKLDKTSRVLDLGCGTGQIALEIAPFVCGVIAVDPQKDMLLQGRALSSARGICNIQWIIGDSNSINDLSMEIGKVDLTTIARAFHWMEREKTLSDLYRTTKNEGGIAVISDSPLGKKQKIIWKEVVDETVKKWLGEERKAGTSGTYSHPIKRHEAILQESKFCGFEMVHFHLEREWSIDQIIGYLYSTSYCSLPILGNKQKLFEEDLRKRLIELDSSGQFREPVTFEIMMVWKF